MRKELETFSETFSAHAAWCFYSAESIITVYNSARSRSPDPMQPQCKSLAENTKNITKRTAIRDEDLPPQGSSDNTERIHSTRFSQLLSSDQYR
jgi:hypothetical protein